MSCKPEQLQFLNELKKKFTKKPSYYRPDWLRDFLNQKPMEPIQCGGFKIVYPFGDFAVTIEEATIEKKNNPISDVINVMKTIPEKYQQHLIYPLETFVTDKYIITKLSLCPNGDLFDIFEGNKKNNFKMLTAKMFVDLANTLDVLHTNNIAVVDLKPDNIMLCKCNCLAFIDLDSVVSLRNGPPKKNKGATPWYNPIRLIKMSKNRQSRDFFVSDWVAFALVVMLFVGIKLRERKYDVLYNCLVASFNRNDNFYDYFQLEYFQNKDMEYTDEFKRAIQQVDISPMKTTVVEKAFFFLNNLIKDEGLNIFFNPKADSYIIAFQDALGMDFENDELSFGHVRLKKIEKSVGRARLKKVVQLKF